MRHGINPRCEMRSTLTQLSCKIPGTVVRCGRPEAQHMLAMEALLCTAQRRWRPVNQPEHLEVEGDDRVVVRPVVL